MEKIDRLRGREGERGSQRDRLKEIKKKDRIRMKDIRKRQRKSYKRKIKQEREREQKEERR